MKSNNGLKNNYKLRQRLTLVHICNCLKRLQDQLKVLTSYKIIRLILQLLIFLHIHIHFIYIHFIRDGMNQRNTQKRDTVRKWYVRKYFELDIYPEMHFQRKSITRRSKSKTNKITFNITYHPVFWDVRFKRITCDSCI